MGVVDTEQAVETTLRIIVEEYNRVFSPDSVAEHASNEELRISAKRARESCEALREALARTGRRNELDEGRNRDLKERLVTETAAVISALRALGVVLA
jgi:hypothetical protein